MINSESELRIVREQIEFLVKARDSARSNVNSNEFYREMESRSFQKKLNQLQMEVNEYENSKAERVNNGQLVE